MLPTHHIWLAIDARLVGGIEVHIVHLANDLLARGLRPTIVLVSDHGTTPFITLLKQQGCPIRCAAIAVTLSGAWRANPRLS